MIDIKKKVTSKNSVTIDKEDLVSILLDSGYFGGEDSQGFIDTCDICINGEKINDEIPIDIDWIEEYEE